MSPILSAVEGKLEALPIPVRLELPDGKAVGAADAAIRIQVHDTSVLAHLAAGEVGVLGEDYVEGKFTFDGSMRDLMGLAAAILPTSPVDAAQSGWLTGLVRRGWIPAGSIPAPIFVNPT